jgi:hypothetical protein
VKIWIGLAVSIQERGRPNLRRKTHVRYAACGNESEKEETEVGRAYRFYGRLWSGGAQCGVVVGGEDNIQLSNPGRHVCKVKRRC